MQTEGKCSSVPRCHPRISPPGLRENPCQHVRKPAGFPGTPAYRLRVGQYRVILTIEDEYLLILVLEAMVREPELEKPERVSRRDTGAASTGRRRSERWLVRMIFRTDPLCTNDKIRRLGDDRDHLFPHNVPADRVIHLLPEFFDQVQCPSVLSSEFTGLDVFRTDRRDQSGMSLWFYAFSAQKSKGCKIHRIVGPID